MWTSPKHFVVVSTMRGLLISNGESFWDLIVEHSWIIRLGFY
jgi:hypothetical protein